MGREVGGGIGMGKTCEPKAFSFQCMTKFTTNKKNKLKKKKRRRWGWGRLTTKKHEKTFKGHENVFYPDWVIFI